MIKYCYILVQNNVWHSDKEAQYEFYVHLDTYEFRCIGIVSLGLCADS